MATYYRILAWRIPWIEEPGRLQSMGLPRVGHDWVTNTFTFTVGWIVQFHSVAQLCLTLCDPMNRSTPGPPVHHQLLEFDQTHVHRISDASSHLILCRPLLLLPPIPPSIRVFSNESTLHLRWPKCWSFSFSISPSMNTQDWSSLEWTSCISLQS